MRKTVLVLGSFAPSLINFRGPLIGTLAALGHRVIAAAPDIDPDTADNLQALGAERLSLTLEPAGMNPLADLAYARDLRRVFEEVRPDVVIAYTAKPIVFGAPAAKAAGAPTVAAMVTGLGFAFTEGGGLRRLVARTVLTRLYRRALRLCDAIMFQNPDDRAVFDGLGLLPQPDKVSIINGSGVDLTRFAPGDPPKAARSFLMIARLIGDKGVREYCNAAAAVKKRHPEVAFRLAGYHYAAPDAISQAELDAWLAQGVEYIGPLDDVRPALKACDVYVLPSYREGTPRSVLEAMATGRPVITTDAPGCRETVTDGVNGFLVPVRDSEAIAAAAVRLIEDPALTRRMAEASLARVRDRYDVDKVNASILNAVGLAQPGDPIDEAVI